MSAIRRWPPWVSIRVRNCWTVTNEYRSGAMGMAAIGIALYKYVMKYSPTNAGYFNRDRFVLSNGKQVF